MVWGGICSADKTSLVFVDEETKINHKTYFQNNLKSDFLAYSQEHNGKGKINPLETFFTLHQHTE